MKRAFNPEEAVIINLDNVSSLEDAKDCVTNTIMYSKCFRLGEKLLREKSFICKEIIDFINEKGGGVFYDFPDIKENVAKRYFDLISTWNLKMVTIPSNFNTEVIRGIKSIFKDSSFVGYPLFSSGEQYDYKETELRYFIEKFISSSYYGIVLSLPEILNVSNFLKKDSTLRLIDKNIYNPIDDEKKIRDNKKIFRSISAGTNQIIIDLPKGLDFKTIPFVFNYLENEINYGCTQIDIH